MKKVTLILCNVLLKTTFTFSNSTENETLKLLSGFKTSKADIKINATLLKDSAEVINIVNYLLTVN